jgi:hypothetical protein
LQHRKNAAHTIGGVISISVMSQSAALQDRGALRNRGAAEGVV